MPVPARPENGGASDQKFAERASPFRIVFLRGGVLIESARAPGGVSVLRGGGVRPDVGEDACECAAAVGGMPCSGSAGAVFVVSAGT